MKVSNHIPHWYADMNFWRPFILFGFLAGLSLLEHFGFITLLPKL